MGQASHPMSVFKAQQLYLSIAVSLVTIACTALTAEQGYDAAEEALQGCDVIQLPLCRDLPERLSRKQRRPAMLVDCYM
jgi:hypothetical protein